MKKKLSLLIPFFIACLCVKGQYEPVTLHANKNSYDNYRFIEQVDMTTDHDFYLAGEKLWIALHTYDANFHMPSTLSAIAYVELYTQDNQVVAQQKIRLEDGAGMGFIQIPKTLQTDYYYVRVYTNYMKNYGPAFFHTRRFGIVNPFYPVTIQENTEKKAQDTSLQVLPESGKLISGVKNKVVYVVKTGHQYCDKIAGRVVDQADSVILHTNSDKGLGTFSFIPLPGQKYRFEAIACGQKYSIDLPEAVQNNAILVDSVVDNKANIKIIAPGHPMENLKLQVVNNGIRYESDYLPQNKHPLQLTLPPGINHLQMVTSKLEILASRYIALEEQDQLEISIDPQQQQTGKREAISFNIRAMDGNTPPDSCKLNVSVHLSSPGWKAKKQNTRWEAIQSANIQRLFPHTAVVDYEPFISDNAWLNHYLVLCSNEQSKAGQTVSFSNDYVPETEKDIISGYVVDAHTGERASGKTILQSFVDSIARLSTAETDSTGAFLIEMPDGITGDDMFLVMKDTTSNYKIHLNNEFSQQFTELHKAVYRPDKSLKEHIQQRMLNMQIQDAYHSSNHIADTHHSDLRFYGRPDQTYHFIDYVTLPTLDEFAFEVVRETMTQRKKNDAYIYVLSEETSSMIGYNPLYLIDGVPLFDKKAISAIPPEIMKTFHVVTNTYYYKNTSFDGIIDLVSKKGDFADFNPPKNAYRTQFIPVQRSVYKTGLDSLVHHLKSPAYLNTIYFNAALSTNEKGEAEIQFHTPDNPGKYSIRIYGYDIHGRTGYADDDGYIEVISE